jgi:stage V sporulation protein AD
MALACFLTLKNHLTNLKKSVLDYDYVITGDLSSLGSQVFLSLCKSSGYPIKKHLDGGKMVYPDDKKYFQGGSGPSCVALILFSYVKKLFLEDKINRVLVIGTGALFSKMSAEQNKTLPTIAHCIELARSL